MADIKPDTIDWDEIKPRLHGEIREFAGPDLRPGVSGPTDEMPGWREWHWYRSKPEVERDPPGLTAAQFAEAYRSDPPFSLRVD
jgi:hypothetical protein